jgi:ribosomal-protein-alanine N-acetyltransferase
MFVGPLQTEDLARVAELAKLSGSGFDPTAERDRPFARLWVVRKQPGASPHGFALVWRAADEVHLLDLAVATEERRAGSGRLLLDAVIGAARAENARLVLLEVRASNLPARALYRSAGFLEHGVRRAYYSDNGEDAIEMRLTMTTEPEPRGDER